MPVRLYVGNLPEEVDRQALEKLFRSAGEVISTKVIRDRKTGKCRGFGFVTVNTEEQAQQYIEKFNGHSFGDVNLRIELAQPLSASFASGSRLLLACPGCSSWGRRWQRILGGGAGWGRGPTQAATVCP